MKDERKTPGWMVGRFVFGDVLLGGWIGGFLGRSVVLRYEPAMRR